MTEIKKRDFTAYIGQYDKEYWIRRIKRLIIQYNQITLNNQMEYKDVIKRCRNESELYCIEQYFKYRDIYIERYKQFIFE